MKTMKHKVPENNETAEIITRLHKSNESTEKNNEAIKRQQSCMKIMNLQAFLFSPL